MTAVDAVAPVSAGEVLLRIDNLTVEYPAQGGGKVHAVSDVSFDMLEGETLSLVGESGCGKSTIGRSIVQLPRPTSGQVVFKGADLVSLTPRRLREARRELQLIYQDPISSLNPRKTIGRILEQPLKVWKIGDAKSRQATVQAMLDSVGIDPSAVSKRPHEFSGGQCQRIAIARALILDPKIIICDEPVSALDVSVQAQILNLLEDMKERYGLTLLFISHDLSVVKRVSDRVIVMYLGKACEYGDPSGLYARPAHPYTKALLAALPVPDPDATSISGELVAGELPSPIHPPSGCRFRTRCPRATQLCADSEPLLRPVAGEPGRSVACHFPLIDADEGVRTA